MYDTLENLFVVFTAKWWVTRQKHIHAHSYGPNVTFLVIETPQHFGRDLVRRSFDAILFLIFDFVAKTEVHDFYVATV